MQVRHSYFHKIGEGRSFPAGPYQARVKVEPEDTGDTFSMAEYAAGPGAWGPPPHRHRKSYETFFVLEGELEVLVGEQKVRAGTGTCVNILPGVVHTFSTPGPGSVRFLTIFSPGRMVKLVEEIGAVLATGGEPDKDKLAAIFSRYDFEVVQAPHP